MIVGNGAKVAEELISAGRGGIDGFNLARTVVPESYIDFVDIVVPELQGGALTRRPTRTARFAAACLAQATGCQTITTAANFAVPLSELRPRLRELRPIDGREAKVYRGNTRL